MQQGEWFFIPAMAEEERAIEYVKGAIVKYAPIGNRKTRAHRAEELVVTEKYGTFVLGSIRHPDHRPLELNGWFLVVENVENRQSWVGAAGAKWFD
jgi:hypothetical protein